MMVIKKHKNAYTGYKFTYIYIYTYKRVRVPGPGRRAVAPPHGGFTPKGFPNRSKWVQKSIKIWMSFWETLRLSESIKQHGIIQPLTIKDNNDGKYLIVAGERRWRAAQIAGLSKVPVRVIQADEKKFSELALVENLQREDLNPIEIAKAIKELIDIYKLTNEEISQIIGKKRSSILNTLRILELPNEIQDLIIQGKLSRGHAIALLSIGFEKEMLKVSRIILEKNQKDTT